MWADHCVADEGARGSVGVVGGEEAFAFASEVDHDGGDEYGFF